MYSGCQKVTLFFSTQLTRAFDIFDEFRNPPQDLENIANQAIENIANGLRDRGEIHLNGVGHFHNRRRQNNALINLVVDIGQGQLTDVIDRGPVANNIIDEPANQARAQSVLPQRVESLHSAALEAFIAARRRAEIANNVLSSVNYGYDAQDCKLFCPILHDFPLIPVLLNGILYDYDSLIKLLRNGFIRDPITREEIKLAPHVIQPHYDAQRQMDDLLNASAKEIKLKQVQAPKP